MLTPKQAREQWAAHRAEVARIAGITEVAAEEILDELPYSSIPGWDDVLRVIAAVRRVDCGEFDHWLVAHDAQVRADEREKIAQAIEEVDPIEWALSGAHAGSDAARIARSGGAS